VEARGALEESEEAATMDDQEFTMADPNDRDSAETRSQSQSHSQADGSASRDDDLRVSSDDDDETASNSSGSATTATNVSTEFDEDSCEALELLVLTSTAESSPRASIWLLSDDSHYGDIAEEVTRAKLVRLEKLLRDASNMTVDKAYKFSSVLGKGN
jgi:hypothetical protein